MQIFGITGGTGAGKSSAALALRSLGAQTLDCDKIYHDLLLSNISMIDEIGAHFSGVVSDADGAVDRRKLSEIVWSDPVSLQELNNIAHKYVNDEVDRRVASFKEQGAKAVAIDAIALIESGQGKKCDYLIGIVAPQEKRIARIVGRDKITREQALKRVNAQQSESFFRENCDYILENGFDTEAEFEAYCIEFFGDLLRRKNG